MECEINEWMNEWTIKETMSLISYAIADEAIAHEPRDWQK